jgi:predicted Zn-dependent peptidase
LKDEIETPQQYLDKIKKVSLSQIKGIAKKLLVPRNLNLALIGPFRDKKVFEKILKAF